MHDAKTEQPGQGETRILLLRHAETAAPDRFHGAESDIGLGERGKKQAEALAMRLRSAGASGLYSSPMRRARETAEAIARQTGLTIEVVPELHERRMGRLSGLSRDEGLPLYQAEKRRWMAGEIDHAMEQAESFTQVRDRVVPVLERIARDNSGKTVIIVAHGFVIRVALATLLADLGPTDFDKIGIETASVNDLSYASGRWRARKLNQILEDAPAVETRIEESASGSE